MASSQKWVTHQGNTLLRSPILHADKCHFVCLSIHLTGIYHARTKLATPNETRVVSTTSYSPYLPCLPSQSAKDYRSWKEALCMFRCNCIEFHSPIHTSKEWIQRMDSQFQWGTTLRPLQHDSLSQRSIWWIFIIAKATVDYKLSYNGQYFLVE